MVFAFDQKSTFHPAQRTKEMLCVSFQQQKIGCVVAMKKQVVIKFHQCIFLLLNFPHHILMQNENARHLSTLFVTFFHFPFSALRL